MKLTKMAAKVAKLASWKKIVGLQFWFCLEDKFVEIAPIAEVEEGVTHNQKL